MYTRSFKCSTSNCELHLTSRSAPASTAPLRSQFCRLAFFRLATRRFTPAIRLPSRFTFFINAPGEGRHGLDLSLAKIEPESIVLMQKIEPESIDLMQKIESESIDFNIWLHVLGYRVKFSCLYSTSTHKYVISLSKSPSLKV